MVCCLISTFLETFENDSLLESDLDPLFVGILILKSFYLALIFYVPAGIVFLFMGLESSDNFI